MGFSLKNIHQKNKIGWRKGRTPSAEASGVGLRPFCQPLFLSTPFLLFFDICRTNAGLFFLFREN
jgi:hypothetical protein